MTDPTIGLWISEDGEVGAPDPRNSYRYVGNNPTNEVDPTGEFGIEDAFYTPAAFLGLVGNAGWQFATGQEPTAVVKYAHQKMRPLTPVHGARALWEYLSYKNGDNVGKPISGMMFRWSLQDNPSRLTFRTTSKLVTAVKASKDYKIGVDKCVAEAINENKTHGYINVDFNSNDLSTSIGRGTLEYKVVKIKDRDNFEFQFRTYDRFNFEAHPFLYYDSIKVGGANNAAWLSQYLDVINGYDWDTEWWSEKRGMPE